MTWQDGAARRVAVAEFGEPDDDSDRERVRWYLEDYAEFPADPAPVIARAAEERLARAGADLFGRVFSGPDAAGIWERARDRLGEVRVEVDADPGAGPGLAWELLRDPARDAAVALAAGTFVRTHLQAAGHPDLPEPAGDRLRVLLVICRPGGRDDVPFRSVAGRLVRGGAGQMDGLDLDVLRPATFARLSQVLHAAYDAGRPYHVVHFDGHGTWLDVAGLDAEPEGPTGGVEFSPHAYRVSLAAPARPGQHGYLVFEDPDSAENQQLADGQTLGRLLAGTGVPVLVLNACRSAYAEARQAPGEASGDVHARIRAYGSLAAEVADEGVPGVVAMRYNVYVVTAAQFVADLYAHLLAGRSLGQAATAARRALAANPVRQIGAAPVELQDWAVPVVYESAPLVLLRPPQRAAPVIRLDDAPGGAEGASELPRPPDAGFFGRDETLLALDRAFDDQPAVLLHAFAGAGKSSTAAEFARWYVATGGLDHPGHPEWGPGTVLWSSFEHHLTADRVIGMAGDHFAGLLEANGIPWAALTDPAQRRDVVLQVLAQLPVLWIWDNVEPVTGFPAGTPSAWTPAEQQQLAALLRDLAQHTRCKVLLTSRRDERGWLGDLPARVRLPAMPMRESVQLAAALAARHGTSLAGADWRPLLRYAAGNPLTITVVVGQALRENLTASTDIAGFTARLRAGEAQLEEGEDAALGRTRSLAASLSYGFARAFTDPERDRLAVLHLFRDTVDVDALRYMGDPETAGEDAVPELAGLDRDTGIALLDRAADIGLLTALGGGYYQIHPALPWYFTTLFTAAYGPAADPAARRAARAYAQAIGALGEYYHSQGEAGGRSPSPGHGAGRGSQPAPRLGPGPRPRALERGGGLPAGPAAPVPADRARQRVGPAGRRHHPGRHRPRHWRAAARPRATMEHRYRLPGETRAGRAGLARRHCPAERHDRVEPRPSCRARSPLPLPASPQSSAPRSATSVSTSSISATFFACRTIPAACRPIRRPLRCNKKLVTARAKPDRRQPRQRLPDGVRAEGPEPSRALVSAQPGAAPGQRPVRPGPVPRLARQASPWNGSTTPGPPARTSQYFWSTSTPHSAATSSHWTSPPPTTTKPGQSSRTNSATSSQRPGMSARRCATTSDPSSIRKPAGTSTEPGRPATTSPSCSTATVGPMRRCTTPAPPWTTTSRPGQARPTTPTASAATSPSWNNATIDHAGRDPLAG